jgi:hypothetical protein
LAAPVDLLGCEYLGGCPAIGSRVLNKVELHFDHEGLMVALAAQGLFTLATAHPVLTLAWPEITSLTPSTRTDQPGAAANRVLRAAGRVL